MEASVVQENAGESFRFIERARWMASSDEAGNEGRGGSPERVCTGERLPRKQAARNAALLVWKIADID